MYYFDYNFKSAFLKKRSKKLTTKFLNLKSENNININQNGRTFAQVIESNRLFGFVLICLFYLFFKDGFSLDLNLVSLFRFRTFILSRNTYSLCQRIDK